MAVEQGELYSDVTDVPTAGTAVAIGTAKMRIKYLIARSPDTNTGKVYIGNKAGDVSLTTGFPLAVGDTIILPFDGSIGGDQIFVDAEVSGNDVAWIATRALAAR